MTNFVYGLLYLVPSNITGDKMANSVNYQHFKTLLNVYEKAYPEKNKNACQNAVAEIWKNMKKDYPSFDELRKEVDRKANEWKELSITKKSRMTDFWPGVRKKVPM